MMGHKICFYGVKWQIISKLSLLPLLILSTDFVGIFFFDVIFWRENISLNSLEAIDNSNPRIITLFLVVNLEFI